MILHAKRIMDKDRHAFERVKDEWLEAKIVPQTGNIFKAWLRIDETDAQTVSFRICHVNGEPLKSELLYIEEPTYITSESDQFTILFSLSDASLEACSEIMRVCGDAGEAERPELAAVIDRLGDESTVERAVVYDPTVGVYDQQIFDPPRSKGEFLEIMQRQEGELKGIVLGPKSGFEGEGIKVASVGISGDRWELSLVERRSGYSAHLDADIEPAWAMDVVMLLRTIFAQASTAF